LGDPCRNSFAKTIVPAQWNQLRITHASPDAPKVNVYIDGQLALGDVDYKQSSGTLR
jgi:hypothetical protein